MKNKIDQFNSYSKNMESNPSSFVIDLKQQFINEEEEQDGEKFKNFWQKFKLEFKKRLSSLSFLSGTRLEDLHLKYNKKINDLAFFFVFKYVILLFYKISYWFGWLAVFIVRFVWLVGLAVGKPITCLIHKISFSSVKIGIIKLFKKLNFYLTLVRVNLTPTPRRFCRDKKVGRKLKIKNVVAVLCKRLRRGKKVKKTVEPPLSLSAGAALSDKHNKHANGLRPILSFAIILLILILPFKAFVYYKSLGIADLRGKVVGASEMAVSDFLQAGQTASELDFSQASASFSSAGSNFLKAKNELDKINNFLFVLAGLLPNDELKLAESAKDILAAGETASNLGKSLSIAMESLISKKEDVLDEFEKNALQAIEYAHDLSGILKKIDAKNLPKEYQEQFLLIQKKLEFLEEALNGFSDLISNIKIFAGGDKDKRYLLIFQNNTEMRASGGFIGSYALIDFKNGKIKNIEVPEGGSYDTEAGLYTRVAAPEPLHLVNPLWHFWDANWWPDWPKSAKKIMWFYEKSNGPTVDGVISFTPTVIEGILGVIGPIDMSDKYGVVINADNFWLTVQAIAEEKPTHILISGSVQEDEFAPKKIIGDLLEAILEELPKRLDKETVVSLIKVLEKDLSQKHILFYFTDNELQKKVEEYGWDGKIKQSFKDYLSVINTNIAGGKSDKKIIETINHKAEVMDDGSIINTVTIKREHTGIKNEPFSGVRNVNWMRVYVPLGSELLEARGFEQPGDIYFENPESGWLNDSDLYREEFDFKIHYPSKTKIYEESWKTVFANWTMVDPGQTNVIYFKYKLPFKLAKKDNDNILEKIKSYFSASQKPLYPYYFLAQKQSGSISSSINSKLILSDNFKVVWKYPEDLNASGNGWDINSDLSTDKYWAVMVEK